MIESHIAFLHPGYNKATNENDLGIILLPQSIPRGMCKFSYHETPDQIMKISNYISLIIDILKPIALPISNIKIPRYNEEGEVSGFGITEDVAKPSPNEEMKTTFFTVVKETDCPIDNFAAQENSNFCGRDLFFNTRLCRGDVGNAFVVLQRGIPTLVSAIGAVFSFQKY